MQSTSPGPLEGNGEEFFLDILFHRMSVTAILRQPLLASRDFSRGTVIKFLGKSVVCSMVVHRVHEDSDDDCNGYTDVEDGVSEWNLRWRPRTACDGGRNKYRRNADQEHSRSTELRRCDQQRQTSECDNSGVSYSSAG